ncbi:type II toxin-antitoxin system RelB/DinJ family antitoxin [Paraburkholderia sp. CNPSo 3272]|uniref:type II toxin-antitoxin system RelB/DinJ family antitoxin n=1 Tax=Paraburkholderia sp. CNPSo 3272 TaxID=2940931 RepID=UPI0020B7498A|nr:type II toxin-antitoxin system RelB/DinJ family antitoxin [Paraburkholderia sp. CNPSo 3272]MCP3727290.1 type II toxin-antitoxin system RelB/DinJ family antitoxin [Paraburkholderia sp. CNPSo 3272]
MNANALVQVRIDPALKQRAAEVLDNMGLTVSDAVRILLTRIANEGALPFDFAVDPVAHDAWFRAKVREALKDPRPTVADEEVEAHFARRRAAVAGQPEPARNRKAKS